MILGLLLFWLKRMILFSYNFRHLWWLYSCHPLWNSQGGWGWREWKIVVDFPLLRPLRVSFPDSWTRKRKLLLALFLSALSCTSSFLSQSQLITDGTGPKKPGCTEGKTPGNSLLVSWYLGFFFLSHSYAAIYFSESSDSCLMQSVPGL